MTDSDHSTYSSPLAERYASRAMLTLWGPATRYGLWRRLWLALAESQQRAYRIEAKQGRNYALIVLGLLGIVLLAGGGYAAWTYRDQVTTFVSGLTGSSPSAVTEQTTPKVLAAGARLVWLPPGCFTDAAVDACLAAGVPVIHDVCPVGALRALQMLAAGDAAV